MMRTGPLIWLCFLLLLCNLIVKSDQFPQSTNLTNSITEDDQDITPKTIDPTFFLFSTETDVQVFKYYTDFSEFTWYNSSKDLRFVIHGWTDYFESGNWMDLMKNTLLQVSDYNSYIVLVDWSRGSKDVYYRSVKATHQVAKAVAIVLNQLQDLYDLNMKQVQCIGHSLGGQTCGFVGKQMRKQGKKIGVVSSFDPAGPNFRMNDESKRVSKNDAYYVEVFHTNMARTALGGLGSVFPAGHVDYYFNGGQYQPGCYGQINVTYDLTFEQFNDATTKEQSDQLLKIVVNQIQNEMIDQEKDYLDCSHSRILDFYTVNFKAEGTCEPIAYACHSYDEFLAGHCADCGNENENCRLVGFFPDQLPDKVVKSTTDQGFYLLTEGQVPFCSYIYQVKVKVSKNSHASRGKLSFRLSSNSSLEEKVIEWRDQFTPDSELTGIIHHDRDLELLSYTFALFFADAEQPPTISLSSIEVNFMSSIQAKKRDQFSSSNCEEIDEPINDQGVKVSLC